MPSACPGPTSSVRFGTSNACTDCHTDKDAAWAAAAVERWFGPERKGFQTWTETFAAARAGKVEAAALLLKLPPAPMLLRSRAPPRSRAWPCIPAAKR